jgi:hypothetical protein
LYITNSLNYLGIYRERERVRLRAAI